MPTTQPDRGQYGRGEVVRIAGSFQTNGSSAPTVFRDGHSFIIASVTRVSQGLYEVVFDPEIRMPEIPITLRAQCGSIASMVHVCAAFPIDSTYDPTAGNKKFRIQTVRLNGDIGGAAAAPTVNDPDSGVRISFWITGSINSAGTDLA